MKKFSTSASSFIVIPIWILTFFTPAIFGQENKTSVVAKSELPSYIAPSCLGKTITRMTPEAMMAMAETFTELKPNPNITRSNQLRVFDTLTKVLDEFYLYPDFKGLDWPAIVAEYRGKIERGLDTEKFYAEMDLFIRKLGDEHSEFQSPVRVATEKMRLAGQISVVGIGAQILPVLKKKYYTILAVNPNSPAEHSGLKQHDIILEVDGLPMIVNEKAYMITRGSECTMAILTVKSPGKEPRFIRIIRARVTGPAPVYARLIPTTDGRRIGYIFLPTFLDTTIPGQVKKALENFGPLDGLVLDNRMNGGGYGNVLYTMLSYFTSGTVAHFLSRTAKRPLNVIATAVNNSQKVPLVILVSNRTVSYAEVFAGIMQDIGRAKVVGQTTAGRVETLQSYYFIDGSRAWIAKERLEPVRSHSNWEGKGVRPDVESHAEWDEFTFENDPALVVALKLLRLR